MNEPELKQTTATTETTDAPEQETRESGERTIFQAIGIVPGEVSVSEEGRAVLTVAGKEYPLFYTPRLRKAFNALKLEIKNTGEPIQRLIVYPKVIHFPQQTKSHQLSFQLVGFSKGEPDGIAAQLQDFEFQLRGLWQFIPVCRGPVVSIFRNFNDYRLDYIKQAEPVQRVRFMKASHIPLMWKDSPIKPFRFNPKLAKEEQGHPAFIQIKAKFLPTRNLFEFDALLAPPLEKPPKFLKASKADKTAVQKEKRQSQPKQKSEVKGQTVAGKEPKPSIEKQKPEAKEQTLSTPKPKPSILGRKPEVKEPKPSILGQNPEDTGLPIEAQEQKPEDTGLPIEAQEQKLDIKEYKPTTERQKPDGKKQKPSKSKKTAKAKEQKPEDKQL